MQQYSSFIFDSYHFDEAEGKIELRYTLDDDLKFTETIDLPLAIEYQRIPMDILDRALFALHIIGGVSYFKTCCPRNIVVRSGVLRPAEAAFWNVVYGNGLAQFFLENSMDGRDLVHFPFAGQAAADTINRPKESGKILVPIGGGKDSIVTAELLRNSKKDVTLLRMGTHPLIDALVSEMRLPIITVERRISPLLLQLNREGALNGHVPITAYVSAMSVLIALLYGFEDVVMSDERSADEGNTGQNGRVVNHQWSKSFQFETLFSAFVHDTIAPDIRMFSLLRPYSDLGIAQRFASMPQYFPLVTSCNRNWRVSRPPSSIGEGASGEGNRWCAECPKCAFTFAMFAAFLPEATLETIFGENLFADVTLTLLYRQLLGLEGMKPFECVGTPEETKAAFLLAHERGDLDDTPVMQMFLRDVLPQIKDPKTIIASALSLSQTHAIPKDYLPLIAEPRPGTAASA
ncbi:MAG: hypothetical protein V1926_01195 [Candidatus Peregrinibacteria bacterium]